MKSGRALDFFAGPDENEHQNKKAYAQSDKEEVLHKNELEAEEEIDPGGKLITITGVIERVSVVQ
jgi:hypothetical protein